MLGRSEVRNVTIMERGATRVELTDDQASALQSIGFCSVTPTNLPGTWRLGDVSKIGVAAVPGLRVHIQPKTPLENLFFLASYAEEQVELDRSFSFSTDEALPTALAKAFSDAVSVSTRKGLLKGYRTLEETGTTVRGRWDIPRQIRRRPGILLPLELTVSDFTEDVAENRLLLTAISLLLRVDTLKPALRRRLTNHLGTFREVSVLPHGSLPEIPITRLNRHYAYPLMLAQLIIEATSWTHKSGHRAGGSFLINMPSLFERFVERALRHQLGSAGLGVTGQDRSYTLDTDGQVRLRPDLLIRRGQMPVGVADIKYKVWDATSGSPPNSDVYQALTYALATGLKRAHLLYVSGDVTPAEFVIASAGKTVIAHTIDLSGSPTAILDSVRRVADEMITTAAG